MKNTNCQRFGLTIVGLLLAALPCQSQDSAKTDSDVLKSALKSGDPILVYVYDSI